MPEVMATNLTSNELAVKIAIHCFKYKHLYEVNTANLCDICLIPFITLTLCMTTLLAMQIA